MGMLTRTLTEAAGLLQTVLIDEISLYSAGEPVTVGFQVTTPLSLLNTGVPALVQETTLQNAVESRTEVTYSVKVSRDTLIYAGMVISVDACHEDPSLVGTKLLLDKVSKNGMATIRKAVAAKWEIVNQEGKEGL